MLFLHIILRWGGVTGPNSGLALEVHVEAASLVYDADSCLCKQYTAANHT